MQILDFCTRTDLGVMILRLIPSSRSCTVGEKKLRRQPLDQVRLRLFGDANKITSGSGSKKESDHVRYHSRRAFFAGARRRSFRKSDSIRVYSIRS
jgi:hypothetical protein